MSLTLIVLWSPCQANRFVHLHQMSSISLACFIFLRISFLFCFNYFFFFKSSYVQAREANRRTITGIDVCYDVIVLKVMRMWFSHFRLCANPNWSFLERSCQSKKSRQIYWKENGRTLWNSITRIVLNLLHHLSNNSKLRKRRGGKRSWYTATRSTLINLVFLCSASAW